MELWIRSQDRSKLCEARFFELDNDKTGIFCFNGESYSVFAGKYKSKERALEVLDEIQKTMYLKDMYINDRQEVLKAWTKFTEEQICDIRTKMSVYEMPQE